MREKFGAASDVLVTRSIARSSIASRGR